MGAAPPVRRPHGADRDAGHGGTDDRVDPPAGGVPRRRRGVARRPARPAPSPATTRSWCGVRASSASRCSTPSPTTTSATLLERAKAWTQRKAERGYHAIAAPVEDGGLGYPRRYASAFARLERQYERPASHETHSVTTRLIAPTIQQWGTPAQRAELVPRFLAARELCCQLFSEPGAGSDLANLGVPRRARRRRVGRQRPEGVELGRPVLRSGAS